VKGAASVQPRQHAAPVDEKNESVEVENSQGGSTVPERSFSPGGESAASVKGPAAPAVVTSDDPVGLNNAAVRFLAEARYEEAAQALQRAIAAAPDQSKFHRNLSVVYERMNRMNEAVAEAQRSVDLAPREPIALVQLCALNVMVLRNAQALTCFEKLIALGALDSDSQTFYGVALLRTGDNRKAVSILEQAARHSPTDIGTLNALGLAYFNLRRYSDSAQCFKQAVEIEPKRGELRFNLAVAQAANRNKEAGLSQYRILREDNPKLAAELYQLLFQDKVVQVAALKKR
ncbi:MAG TPA: tetratricopeptide repeat protein, partial [Pyrinomonadaceae bacterium]|nr:tetratricopeptide repeat protein [Pyrinomonadaceae bacterium]